MKNNIFKAILVFVGSLLFVQCEDVLDKTDMGNITEDAVWNDPNLATNVINRIYQMSNPGWPVAVSGISDDAAGQNNTMYGRLVDNSNSTYSSLYSNIRECNIALEGIEQGSIEESKKAELKGQALFFRAHSLWQLVKTYGGVPIIKETLQPSNELERPRNTTSECVVAIIEDLDSAIEYLPDNYAGAAYGRITKGAAMAYKGRILLHYASEHFDPNQSATGRWQDAYNALKEAKINLDQNGKGLHESFSDLWFDDTSNNPEAIWVRLYNTDNSHSRDASVRPFQPGFGGGRTDNPTKSLIDAFPMKDGKSISDNSSVYEYDPIIIWKDRDPRFKATMVWNGVIWNINIEEPFKTSDVFWTFQRNTTNIEADARVTYTGWHTRKAIDVSLNSFDARRSTVQWIEMRYAELLLNLAEAGNEIGNGAEALDFLISIRERAGLDAGDNGRYGLDQGLESNKNAMREAILLERRLELAFEGHRSKDLKRRRLYSGLNGTQRMGFYIDKTDAFDALVPSGSLLDDRIALENMVLAGTVNLNNPEHYQMYFSTEVYSVEEGSDMPGLNGTDINYLDKYYFMDIPESILNRNPKLEQTIGWPGGTFDPLQ